jgi:hypothetical protein
MQISWTVIRSISGFDCDLVPRLAPDGLAAPEYPFGHFQTKVIFATLKTRLW